MVIETNKNHCTRSGRIGIVIDNRGGALINVGNYLVCPNSGKCSNGVRDGSSRHSGKYENDITGIVDGDNVGNNGDEAIIAAAKIVNIAEEFPKTTAVVILKAGGNFLSFSRVI